jgi:hypothetical protein
MINVLGAYEAQVKKSQNTALGRTEVDDEMNNLSLKKQHITKRRVFVASIFNLQGRQSSPPFANCLSNYLTASY